MKKLLGYILIFVVVANLLLFALQIINQLIFWSTMAIIALIAYRMIPAMDTSR